MNIVGSHAFTRNLKSALRHFLNSKKDIIPALFVRDHIVFICSVILLFHFPFFRPEVFAREKPSQNLSLENGNIKVVLNREYPAILQYEIKTMNEVLENPSRSAPEISFYKGALPVMRTRIKITYDVKISDNQASYHTTINYKNAKAIEFNLVYSLEEHGIRIAFNNVTEQPDFYLLDVHLPDLLVVRSDKKHARLAIPADAGRLIDIEPASIKRYEYGIDWIDPVLTGFAYNSKVIGIIDSKSIENRTIAAVSERKGIKYGSFSVRLMHRLKEYNLQEFGTIIPVTNPE